MIEANEPTNGTVVKQTTPAKISTTQILTDLENGIGRDGIKEKYSLETWMVTEIFKHPKLKGKKAKKKRALPFEFVDDTTELLTEVAEIANPNQMSIEEASYDAETMEIKAKVELIDGTILEEEDNQLEF